MKTSTAANEWTPPGKNCGACGNKSCEMFMEKVRNGDASVESCPFYGIPVLSNSADMQTIIRSGRDIVGQEYDFVIDPIPGEPSARKIVLPFRGDLVEKLSIGKGDIVTGRPMGAGCPVQHVIRVIDADPLTGVITGHVVGPAFSRGHDVIDVKEYHMLGFEGKAIPYRCEPRYGERQSFMPGFCMMDRAHTGIVNMIIRKPWGIQTRVEGIVIL